MGKLDWPKIGGGGGATGGGYVIWGNHLPQDIQRGMPIKTTNSQLKIEQCPRVVKLPPIMTQALKSATKHHLMWACHIAPIHCK